MTGYTPGPWIIEEEHDGKPPYVQRYFWISSEKGQAPVDNEWAIIKEENAHLIAAAPDLCEALQGFVTYHSGHVLTCPELIASLDAALEALAKARGERA